MYLRENKCWEGERLNWGGTLTWNINKHQTWTIASSYESAHPFWRFKWSPAQGTRWSSGGVWITGHSLDVQLQISLQQPVHFSIIIIIVPVTRNKCFYWLHSKDKVVKQLKRSLTVFLKHNGCNSRWPSLCRGCAVRGGWPRSETGHRAGARCQSTTGWLRRSRDPPMNSPTKPTQSQWCENNFEWNCVIRCTNFILTLCSN